MAKRRTGTARRIHHGVLLGKRARERRLELGWTQEYVAERMGPDVDANWVTQLETGQKKLMINQPELGQLARALKVPESDLLRASGLLSDEAAVETTPDSQEVRLMTAFAGLHPLAQDQIIDYAEWLKDRGRGGMVGSGESPEEPNQSLYQVGGGVDIGRADRFPRAIAEGEPEEPSIVGGGDLYARRSEGW